MRDRSDINLGYRLASLSESELESGLEPHAVYVLNGHLWRLHECVCLHCGPEGASTLKRINADEVHCVLHGGLQALRTRIVRHFRFEVGTESVEVDAEEHATVYVRSSLSGPELSDYIRTKLLDDLEEDRKRVAAGEFD